ncbi:MAG: fatty acid desaturase [Alphaproteobacteria bacterium]|nr:fatty acid desaturase [Alphaproteobacteria bacterium]
MVNEPSLWRRWELPTWGVAAAIYGAWAGLALAWNALPAWVSIPVMAWLLAWHGSLQHETIHGHPTRIAWINAALGTPPVALWLPYPLYRSSHLTHHCDEDLTIPAVDPESYYVRAQDWARASAPMRLLLTFHHTLLGRFLLGPALALRRFGGSELAHLARGEHLGVWVSHIVFAVPVLAFLWYCQISPWGYALACYFSISLTQVRSFAEHKASTAAETRTAIVEAAWPMALLFLNNNLHARHHARPDLPWYELPRFHREAAIWEGLRYEGYAEIAARFLVTPVDRPVRFMDLPKDASAVAETLAKA